MSKIVAELSTNHGGNLELAEQMVIEAAKAGADLIKTQHYLPAKINPSDPQRDWLTQSALTIRQQGHLKSVAEQVGVTFMSTPFCAEALQELRDIGLTHFKIASSESGNKWWRNTRSGERWFVSYPWGRRGAVTPGQYEWLTTLTAIPLYPTPLECLSCVNWLEGYSDHCVGLSACEYAIARGVKVIEVHFKIEGKGRNCVWDKTADDIRRLRAFADDCATMTSGVATRFRNRWTA